MSIEEGNKIINGRYQVLPNGTVLGRMGRPLRLYPNKSGMNRNAIQDACRGRLKTYNGFIWKYKD